MKGNGSRLVKQIISMVRSKTDGVKARLMVTAFTLLSKRKKLSDAIDGIFGDASKGTIVLFEKKAAATGCSQIGDMGYSVEEFDDDDDDDKYPDLRHSLFDEEEEKELAQLLDDPSSSISAIDIVKNGKEKGEKFNLEDEIDEVADLFITKFHKRMRLQKLLSFKRQAAEPRSDP
ncbi:hypothetical protein ACS0TY_010733 [Phlomoides rotata]